MNELRKLQEWAREAGAGRVYMVKPRTSTRRPRARERQGNSRERMLNRRHRRGEFGERELNRRMAQLWASI